MRASAKLIPAARTRTSVLPSALGVGDVDELERPVDLAQQRGSQLVGAGSCANCSRSAVLRNLPTLVFGISATNSMRSGSHHFAKLRREELAQLVRRRGRALLQHDGRERPLGPLLVGDREDGRLGHGGCAMSAFSSSTEEIHSPPDLMTSFERSLIWM